MSSFRYNMMQMAILSALSVLDHETPETAVRKRGSDAHKYYFRNTRDGRAHCPLPYVHTTKQQDDEAKLISRSKRMARFVRNRVIHCNSPTIFATVSGN